MPLSSTELAVLRTAILNEPDLTFQGLRQQGATGAIADWFNQPSAFVVWRSTAPLSEIADAINWAALTPADPPDDTQLWLNRAIACQSFQFNLQNMLLAAQSAGAVSSGRVNVRKGWQDSTSAVPSGAGGAQQSAGWQQIRQAMQRSTTRAEKLFATGVGTQGNPGNLVFEGQITDADVVRTLPW